MDSIDYSAALGKIWLSVIIGFCGWVHEKGIRAAEGTLSTNEWKSSWKWKVRNQKHNAQKTENAGILYFYCFVSLDL